MARKLTCFLLIKYLSIYGMHATFFFLLIFLFPDYIFLFLFLKFPEMEIQKNSPKHRTDENISVRNKIKMGRSEEIDNNLISWSIMQLVFWNKSQ